MTNEIATREAKEPFHFNSAASLLRIGRERANDLAEFLEAVRTCPEAYIFQHTFRTLQEHHFIREGFSNDFAHWVYTDCNEVGLGEMLAALDVRIFTSIFDLRQRIVDMVEDYIEAHPESAHRPARKAFFFCASETVVMPTPFVAKTLPEFTEAIKNIPIHSVHHHFIEARLRQRLQSNDFSIWLNEDMSLPQVAAKINRIDIYTATLEGVRQQIVRTLTSAIQ